MKFPKCVVFLETVSNRVSENISFEGSPRDIITHTGVFRASSAAYKVYLVLEGPF